jgi:4-aminobutyrate aminotransferase-like enzyme
MSERESRPLECVRRRVVDTMGVKEQYRGNFGNVLRLQPPLVITEQQLETVVSTIADGLAACAANR